MALVGLSVSAEAEKDSENVVTQRVVGEWILSPESDESPREAFFKAMNEARRKAIVAVCGERVSSWDTLLTHNESQTYSGVVVTNSVGIIHRVKELRRGWRFPKAGEAAAHESPSVFVEAEIAVKKSTEEADPAFTALIEGGRGRYKHGDDVTFWVKTSQAAYLTVFWQNHDFQADLVFPQNRWEDGRISNKKAQAIGPMIFEISAPRARKESGTLFFVLTKRRYPFLSSEKTQDLEKNRERLEHWMASIPLRERFIYAVPFIIER